MPEQDLAAASQVVRPPAVRLVILALAMGGFAVGLSEFAAMGLLPYYMAELRLSEAEAGHAVSAYAVGVVVGAPLIAMAGARMSRRRLLITLMLAYGVFNGLSALAPDYLLLLVSRFFSGLPHGAYFGVASILGASLVPIGRRTRTVSTIMLGLTAATTVGVPVANLLGEFASWRWAFVLVAAASLFTAVMIAVLAPHDPGNRGVNLLSELSAFRNPLVLMLLATGAVGFGGLFAVYTYATSVLMEITAIPPAVVPLYLVIFGVGMSIGTLGFGIAADRWPSAAPLVLLGGSVPLLLAYPLIVHSATGMGLHLALTGTMGALGPLIQTRLMDAAGSAQTMAAAMNHSAFNLANALGPWLAGLAIAAGWGLQSSGPVGAVLSVGGILLLLAAIRMTPAKAAT